jgi:hypothetical protein
MAVASTRLFVTNPHQQQADFDDPAAVTQVGGDDLFSDESDSTYFEIHTQWNPPPPSTGYHVDLAIGMRAALDQAPFDVDTSARLHIRARLAGWDSTADPWLTLLVDAGGASMYGGVLFVNDGGIHDYDLDIIDPTFPGVDSTSFRRLGVGPDANFPYEKYPDPGGNYLVTVGGGVVYSGGLVEEVNDFTIRVYEMWIDVEGHTVAIPIPNFGTDLNADLGEIRQTFSNN